MNKSAPSLLPSPPFPSHPSSPRHIFRSLKIGPVLGIEGGGGRKEKGEK